MEKYIIEHFKTVYDFERTLNKRTISGEFDISDGSSRTSDTKWYQTESYEEADNFLINGWNAKIDELKGSLEKYSRKIAVQNRITENNVVGFMPNVPRAIRGYPGSMISNREIKRTEKRNTIHIIYSMTANCGTHGEGLLKAGIVVLKIAMVLDRSNIRTKIDLVPFLASEDGEYVTCIVGIKDYRQSFNYSKMAYPIVNPSFFRRHGFRYLETLSGITAENWCCGYGRSIADSTESNAMEFKKKAGFYDEGVIFITYNDCQESEFDPIEIMAKKGINLK